MAILKGTWRFNEVLVPPTEYLHQDINYQIQGVPYDFISISIEVFPDIWYIHSFIAPESALQTQPSEASNGIVIIPTEQEVSEDFYNWFVANATEVKTTIKAGTYRFNDVLSVPSADFTQSIYFTQNPTLGTTTVVTGNNLIGWETDNLHFNITSIVPSVDGYSVPLKFVPYGGMWGGGWISETYGTDFQIITIPEDSEVTAEFYEWFTANAVEVVEHTVSGVWKFKDVLTVPSEDFEQVVNFQCLVNLPSESVSYTGISQLTANLTSIHIVRYGEVHMTLDSTTPDMTPFLTQTGTSLPCEVWVYVYDELGGYWREAGLFGSGYQTIDFGTEPQTVSAEFYEWLTANATQPTATIQYNGSTIASLFNGQTATLKCKGMKMETDLVVEVAEQNLQTKEVIVSESGTIEITPDSGYDGLSKIILSVNVAGGGSGDSGNAVEIVSWAGGTDEQIAAMVAALDNGTLTIEETGWQIGDERKVTLSAMDATGVGESYGVQEVTMVLMDSQHYTLTEATAGGDTKDHFVVGLKKFLPTGGYMNSSNTSEGSWGGCARRTWCNEVFRAAIPNALRACFKQFKVPTATAYNGSSVTETDDYFALFAEMEIFGVRTYSNITESAALSQIEWFATAANRNKGGLWWGRSLSTYDQRFCSVKVDGNPDYLLASATAHFAPFGCI